MIVVKINPNQLYGSNRMKWFEERNLPWWRYVHVENAVPTEYRFPDDMENIATEFALRFG